jgi:hypothetical protein
LPRSVNTANVVEPSSEGQILDDLNEATRFYLVRSHSHAGPADGQVMARLVRRDNLSAKAPLPGASWRKHNQFVKFVASAVEVC